MADIGLSVGAIALAKEFAQAFPFIGGDQKKGKALTLKPPAQSAAPVDFRYAPKNWQSTYCFPDDPFKSLVGKHGELLYGHQGINQPFDVFPHVVSVELAGAAPGTYVGQSLESPAIPIITTKLEWAEATATLISFATKDEDEGRVDNLILEFTLKGADGAQCSPAIAIKSSSKCTAASVDEGSSSRGQMGIVRMDGSSLETAFIIVDSPIVLEESEGVHHVKLQAGTLSAAKPMRFFLRFPQEGQKVDKVKDGLKKSDRLLTDVRTFWHMWKPFQGTVDWKVRDEYQNFLVASTRNILEAREVKNGKPVFQVGSTISRGLWYIDGVSLLEAARYLGHDAAAKQGLEYMWDQQRDDGSFVGGAGEKHWKDTAAAVYALCRHADLTQNWDYFNELYPDAYKAIMYLRDLRTKGLGDGTMNGKYGFLPPGFGDSGLSGIRSELTNTLWTIVATSALLDIADRFFLSKRSDLRDFLRDLKVSAVAFNSELMRRHPNGFNYLPMLLSDDPQWPENDERKQPRPQVAQIYLSQAIYPGLAFPKDHRVTTGHIELMKAVTKEDIPIETGWLNDRCVSTYNAAVVAQMYLWAGLPDLARKTFIGFLNHASPLYAWREEQSLQDAPFEKYIGDMPHNWASAECIRYLRHMMILEDSEDLRLLQGIGQPELEAKKQIAVVSSPTKWGRVSMTHEPAENNRWVTRFKREALETRFMPALKQVILPRRLPVNMQFDKLTGAKFYKNGPEVFVDAAATSWEATWINFAK